MAQAPVRRSAPARGAARPAPRPAARTAGRSQYRGEDGMRRAAEEIEKSKEKERQRRERGHAPMRFRMKSGETKQAVILDDKPDFFQYEHNGKDADGRWNIFSGCVKEQDNCPACAALGKESYYAMYLTVLDLTPFELKSGETVEFSRKLLVVKNQQQKKFMRMYEKEGTLRGMILDFTRDGDKEPAIGNDIEFVDWMPEDELATYVREWTDREKKRHIENCNEPYNYEEIFPEPTTEGLRAQFGGSPPPGSRAAEEAELGGRRSARRAPPPGDDWDDPEADGAYGDDPEAAAPRRGARAAAPVRGRRGAPAPAAEEPELRYAPEDIDPESGLPYEDAVPLEDGPGDDPQPPARGRRSPPAAPAGRRTRAAPAAEEPDPDADPEADDPPAPRRGAAAPRRGAQAAAPRRGAAPARRSAPAEDPEGGAPRRVSFRRSRPE